MMIMMMMMVMMMIMMMMMLMTMMMTMMTMPRVCACERAVYKVCLKSIVFNTNTHTRAGS